MKANSSARYSVRIRFIAVCVAISAIAAIEFGMSERLAARFGQVSVGQADSQAP